MTVRNITKQLAATEDLLLGTGTAQQLRGGTLQTVNKFTVFQPVADLAALKGLDVAKYAYAVIASASSLSYYFDSLSTDTADDFNVVAPTNGVGRWILSGRGKATAINLADVSAQINVLAKYEGKPVWDSTNKKTVWAAGAAAADLWLAVDGSTVYTPV